MFARSTTMLGTVALLIAGLAGCGGAPPARLAIENRDIRVSEGDCESDEARACALFTVAYPEFSGTTEALAGGAEALNREVFAMLTTPEVGRDPSRDALAAMGREFVDGWTRMREEFPDAATVARWYSDRDIEVVHHNERVVSLRLERSEYTGGAHPNSVVMLASFALPVGKRVTLSDVLIEDYRTRLDGIAEHAFRGARDIAPDADLTAEGYWFEGGRFAVNTNFALEASGIRFHFDPYEVAPYATGPIEFVVRVEDLRPVLRPDAESWFDGD